MSDREWVLLNPGPANTSRSVREALVTPDLCHREPEFFEVMRECREGLVRLAGCADRFAAVLFTGSGTAAVEAAVASAVPPGRALLVVNNGVYGDRLARIARAHGIPAEVLTYGITTPVPPADVARALAARPEISHVAVVHHETTTGLLNPVGEVARVAAAAGRRVVIDAMSSLFGEPLQVDAEGDNTPFTPAVQVLHAMRQALRELEAEGVERRIARYAENARVLRAGMAALGFEVLVPEGARSSILTTFRLLPGLEYDALHDAMKGRGYVIYAGQGDIRRYAFRVANMGTLTPRDMAGVVEAFRASLADLAVEAGR
jgi:2-aminoethylphosphonate-pyruvate transaminase